MANAMLSFKLGPVQPFIEAARTLRDLWSGSYLLSWLTAHGMKALHNQPGVRWITPDVDPTTNPLLAAVLNGQTKNEGATTPCLPHTFAAEVPADQAVELKEAVLKAVEDEWKKIADAVKKAIGNEFATRGNDPDWAANWDAQITNYFDFRAVVLDLTDAPGDVLELLGVKKDTSQESDDDQHWGRQWTYVGALLDLARSVKHVPAYKPADRAGRFPVKCSLLGSFEQMGPAEFDKSREFWARLTKLRSDKKNAPGWEGLNGTRLQSSDKLCAVSLVKRFAWPVYWAGRLELGVQELSFTDTATMAASLWMPDLSRVETEDEDFGLGSVDWRTLRRWSGQWLHWATRDQDKDEKACPLKVWNEIQSRKTVKGRPPTYFALLLLDGDNMGNIFQGDVGKQFGDGIKRFQAVTNKLTAFSVSEAKRIVETKCGGELIYAGGDDVLAFLPTEIVIECARQLREAFEAALPGATLSGGIAVVHYKEDLRFALAQVRAAEKAAKRIAKSGGDPSVKDALALTICKRSGEHSTVVMGWPEAETLQQLVGEFAAKASDRWAYKLREELETLKFLPLEAGKVEALRLVGRGEFGGDAKKKAFLAVIEKQFDAYQKQMQLPARNWPDADVLTGFVALCQSASFLARGKE